MAVGVSSHVVALPKQEGEGDHVAHDQATQAVEAVDLDIILQKLLPAYRLLPQDHVLIQHYLRRKVENKPLPYNKIHKVNIYNHNPTELAELYKPWGEENWYFFTERYRKYPNGTRPKRKAGNGYWKATGGDKKIEDKGEVIGYKKVLVFYEGKSKGVKSEGGENTKWVMNEYRVVDPYEVTAQDEKMLLDKCVLCKIYKKAEGEENPEGQKEDMKENKRRQKRMRQSKKTTATTQIYENCGNAHNTEHDNSIAASPGFMSMAQAQDNAVPLMSPPISRDVAPDYRTSNSNIFTTQGMQLHGSTHLTDYDVHGLGQWDSIEDSHILGFDDPMGFNSQDLDFLADYDYSFDIFTSDNGQDSACMDFESDWK